MPYISKEDRKFIDDELNHWVDERQDTLRGIGLDFQDLAHILRNVPSDKTKGAFNYFVSRLWSQVFNVRELGYTDLSDAIAVFGDMEAETRRRLMDTYEDFCITGNGDLPEWENIK